MLTVVRVTINVKLLAMKLNEISQEKVFWKLSNSAVVMVRVVFFQFVAPHGRAFKLSSLWTHKTNGPSSNKYHNFGFVFNGNM